MKKIMLFLLLSVFSCGEYKCEFMLNNYERCIDTDGQESIDGEYSGQFQDSIPAESLKFYCDSLDGIYSAGECIEF